MEIDYLRAQIARISASTQIYPKGYYIKTKKQDIRDETSNNNFMTSSNSMNYSKNIKYKLI